MKEKYLVFVVFIYEQKDQAGNFQNSTELQLICNSVKEAYKKAIEVAGDEKKKHIHLRQVIEKYVD